MGFFGGLGKFVFYPVLRPMQEAGKAYKGLKSQALDIKAQRAAAWQREMQRRAESARALNEQQAKGSLPAALAGITEEDILDPLRIKDDALRFEALYRANGWNGRDLQKQLLAKRRGKRVGLAICVASFLTALAVMLLSRSVLYPILLTPVAFIGSFYGFTMALRMGLHQAQIEHRRLFSLKVYASRPDLFRHLIVG